VVSGAGVSTAPADVVSGASVAAAPAESFCDGSAKFVVSRGSEV